MTLNNQIQIVLNNMNSGSLPPLYGSNSNYTGSINFSTQVNLDGSQSSYISGLTINNISIPIAELESYIASSRSKLNTIDMTAKILRNAMMSNLIN